MKRKATDFLNIQVTASIVTVIALVFALTAALFLILQSQLEKKHFVESVRLASDKKSLELDTCLTSIENAVDEAKVYILNSIDEERILTDSEYEKEYMSHLSEELVRLARFTKGAAALYFRMNMEKFGGSRGIFLEWSTSGFLSVMPTDLTKYSPTDTEHVSWYYNPVWKGAPAWLPPYENKNINIHMISYVVPIYRNSELLGVVGMDINIAMLKGIIDVLPFDNSLAVLIGEENNLIYCTDARFAQESVDYSVDIPPMLAGFADSQAAKLQKFTWNFEFYHGLMTHLENGMSFVLAMPDDAFAKVRVLQAAAFLTAFAAACILTFLLLFFIQKNVISPIKIITDTTFKLARGELNLEIPYRSKNDLGVLAGNIRMMTSQMKEYIAHISEQTKKERKEKELAITENRSKSEFLASMYLSLHEIDMVNDTFVEVHSRSYVTKAIGVATTIATANANHVIQHVMGQLSEECTRKAIVDFVNLKTLDERLKDKMSITQEFLSVRGYWCKGRFIPMDRDADGKLHHVLWAVENIQEERSERERLQNEAEQQAAASQAKSTFLANMSHEIRTPINAVLGMDEMILREAEDRTILGYAVNIKAAGMSLLSIVNDILDFSKIEAGKMEIIPENYEVCSLVVDLVNMIRGRVESKGLALVLQADPGLPRTLYGDSVRIKQCILNLLTNAVKYTDAGTVTFTVGYTRIDDSTISLAVSVKDTGSGIKAEDMEKLFSPFERIEEDKNRTIEGSGLGMSIVTRMLAMMNSKLSVESEYGRGSVFSFAVEQPVIDWTKVGNITDAFQKGVDQIAGYREKLRAPRARLLFVDDTAMNLEVIKGLLKKTGIQLDTVLSGKAALEKVTQHVYDILFIDHRMPEMDGIETLHAMQSLKGNLCAGKPCIALTANALTGVRKMYLDEGFTDYISKPVNPDKLEEMIRAYLPPDYLEAADGDETEQPDTDEENRILSALKGVDGIDAEAALAHCETAGLLAATVKGYYESINEKAAELQQLYEAENWKDYNTKVHALKSTSRLIGAMELSEKAAYLEACSEKNDGAELAAKHRPFMDLFRSYRQKLEPFIQAVEEKQDEKPQLSEAEAEEKLAQIGRAAADFDIDGLDALMTELSEVSLPEAFAERFAEIRSCAERVDFIGLQQLFAE